MPMIWKQALAPGVYMTQTGPFVCTSEDIGRYSALGNEMVRCGLQIPVPLEHQDGAVPMSAAELAAAKKANSVLNNAGWVKEFRVQDGVLECLLDIPDQDTFDKLSTTIRFVSPEINTRIDMTGKDWGRVVTHLALTPIPIWHDQKPFDLADIVEEAGSDGAALMAPVGKPLPFSPVAAQLSAAQAGSYPVRLSLAQVVVEKDGAWYPTRLAWEAQTSRKGTVKAVDSASGKKLYGKQAEAALAKQARAAQGGEQPVAKAPKAKAAPRAGKKVAKPAATAITSTPEQEKEFTERERLRELPVTKGKGKAPTKGYSKTLGKLPTPAFASLAKRIDADEDIHLTDQALANTRRAYTLWRKKFPSPADFAAKIEAAWKLDEEQVAKGKKRDARGASYAARALGFRHMLQWAEEDLPKETHDDDYKRLLAAPIKDRWKQIAAKRVQSEHAVKTGGAIFRDQVIHNMIERGLVKGLSKEEFDPLLYKAALNGTGKYEIPLTPEQREENKTRDKKAQIQPEVVSLPPQVTPTKYIDTVRQNVANQLRRGQYSDAEIEPVLAGLSKAGIGTLSPKEFRNMNKKVRLSQGDGDMADEKDNDELFEEGTGTDSDNDGDNDTEKEGVADKIAKVCDELKDLGVVVNCDGDDPEEFLDHLATALMTHKATKGDDTGSDNGSGISDMPPATEQQPQMGVAMSAAMKQQQTQLSFVMSRLADAEYRNVSGTIEDLRKTGRITPAVAKAWTEKLGAKRLSLAGGAEDAEVGKIMAQLELAKENPVGTFWDAEQRVKLSAAHEVAAPEYVDNQNGNALDPHVMAKLSGGRYKAPAKN